MIKFLVYKNAISQIKQKMLFFPSVKRYKVIEDF